MNGDGRISIFEFTNLVQSLAKNIGGTFAKRGDIEELFMAVDTDGDATISKLEYK